MVAHAFVVHASEWGSSIEEAKYFGHAISEQLKTHLSLKIVAFKDTDVWLPSSYNNEKHIALFVLGTAEEGLPPSSCREAASHLNSLAYDHREERQKYARMTYIVVGRGDSVYRSNFGKWTIELDKTLHLLGAKRGLRCMVEDSSNPSRNEEIRKRACAWLADQIGKFETSSALVSQVLDSEEDEDEDEESVEDSNVDMEDMGQEKGAGPTDMITESQRKVLQRQGYKLIGSHSAVKLCRWTKHQLRGQGGCYKHTFYGINSHQCMEATSSLACANKCVFCWRHHKNPVGTSWRWNIDDPIMIVREGLAFQRSMIRERRGVPGVEEKGRLSEAMTVKHCALSLVGEPIMYPRINELLEELHRLRISTFLVTNAQFPEQIRDLSLCTQLYVSIDGTSPEQLKKIDRPLFRDYWERFRQSLLYLRDRKERTVYRVTLVKDYNDSDPQSYVELVALGHPDLIELKGVTFAGHSLTSGIRMDNVPTHSEVLDFSRQLKLHLDNWRCSVDPQLPVYEVALEHEHSCSVLLAKQKFRCQDGNWKLWIDFEGFFEWAQRNKENALQADALEYSVKAPDWALCGSHEKGFDPNDTRKYSKKRQKEMEGASMCDSCTSCV